MRRGKERTKWRQPKRKPKSQKLQLWKVETSFFVLLKIILDSFTAPRASLPASPIQEMTASGQVAATAPSSAPNPPAKDSSDKGKSPIQDSGVSPEELESFPTEHENLVLSVSDPSYTRRLIAFMNARMEKRLLEGIVNALFLYVGMVFQQLEDVRLLEVELKEARTTSEKLKQEKDEVSTALGVEKAVVVSLKKEKSLALEEKKSAMQAKELALAAQKKFEEDKAKLAEEHRQAIERADVQNLELQAKCYDLK